jgi:hypothetical protein
MFHSLAATTDHTNYTSFTSGTGKLVADVIAAVEKAPPPSTTTVRKYTTLRD